jgi:hypothetical protein
MQPIKNLSTLLFYGTGQIVKIGRVAGWFVFKSKIPICVNFRGPLTGKY